MVVSIISILAAVIYGFLNSARNEGVDTKRMADIDQLALLIRLYAEANGSLPGCGGGSAVRTGVDACITSALEEYIAEVPTDDMFGYFYDSSGCGSEAAVYVEVAEADNANWSTVCSAASGEQWYGRVF